MFAESDMRSFSLSIAWITVFALSAALPVLGQKIVSEPVARKHLTHEIGPVYSPIAQAARVQGSVVIAVVIGSDGSVTSEKVLSGPPMLQQAALDAVKQWHFTPFQEGGVAATVNTTLTIPFVLNLQRPQPNAEQEKAAQALFPLSDK